MSDPTIPATPPAEVIPPVTDEKPLLSQEITPPAEPAKPEDKPVAEEPKPILDKDGKPVLDKDGKPTFEEKKPEEPKGAPETYADFKLPEGVSVEADDLGKFTALAKEANLPQEQAQKFLDMANEHVAKLTEKAQSAQLEQWATVRKEWTTAIRADPEIGGQNFGASREYALRAVKSFGTPELVKEVFESGWGDNPHLFKFCVRAGKAMSEDKSADGLPSGSKPKSAASVLFPSQA